MISRPINLISAFAASLAMFATASSVRAATLEFDLLGDSPMLSALANAPMGPQDNRLTYDGDAFYINGRPSFIHAGEIHALELGPQNALRLADGKLPANNRQLWRIFTGAKGSTLENVTPGSRLNAGGNAVHWQIAHADECYSTISNLTAGVVLDAAAPTLRRVPDAAPLLQVRLVGHQFSPFDTAKPSWGPAKCTYGEFVEPGGSSLLMEATVPVRATSSRL